MRGIIKQSLSWAMLVIAGCCAAPVQAVRFPRVELLREATVSGARISLSDLLPAGAGDSLRAQASQISLGAAPQPGVARSLDRGAILHGIGPAGDWAEEIGIPDHVVVFRDARPLTVGEVLAAIREWLGQQGSLRTPGFAPDAILLQSEILVPPGDARLKVLRSEFDPEMKKARFLVATATDPKILPFYITVALPEGFDTATHLPNRKSRPQLIRRSISGTRGPGPEILVTSAQSATLLLQSEALSMMAAVTPLERGAMGQSIRVRVTDTGKVFRATVDGRAHLELEF